MIPFYQNSELTLVQCECHIGKQSVIARINPANRNKLRILFFLYIFGS